MTLSRGITTLHANLSDVAATQHHTATVGADLALADLATRAHTDLSDAPADAHHAKYADAEAVAAVEAAATLTIQGQVAFPASQSASADANTLDDYEEGAWTPTIQDNSRSDAESQTYDAQIGRYTKIGNRVFIQGRVVLTSAGSLTGGESVVVGGLPFTSANVANRESSCAIGKAAGLAITAGNAVVGNITPNSVVMDVFKYSATTGITGVTVTEFSADGSLSFMGHYEV